MLNHKYNRMFLDKVNKALQLRNKPIQLLIAAVIGLIFSVFSLMFSPLWVSIVIIGVYCFVIFIKKPELGLLAILTLTSSIVFEDQLPLIPIGIGSLNIPDILLIMLLTLIVVKLLVETEFEFVHTPLDLPILLFPGIILLSTFIALDRGLVSTEQALRGIRTITYYLTFFIVTNLVCRKDQLFPLVEGIILLATVVAFVMVVTTFCGIKTSEISKPRCRFFR